MTKRRLKRVPFIPQAEEGDCGAACLAMVASAFGRRTSISEVLTICPAGRDGITAMRLAKASSSFGLRATTLRTSGADLSGIATPCIVHWHLTHWIVVQRWKPNSVAIIDPGTGPARISHSEFADNFTGIVMTFTPLAVVPAEQHSRHSSFLILLWTAFEDLRLWKEALSLCGTSLFLQLLSMMVPLILSVVVDRLVPGNALGLVHVLGFSAACLIASQTLASWARTITLVRLRAALDGQAMPELVERLLKARPRFFDAHSAGDLLSRISNYTNIRQNLTDWAVYTLLDGTLVVIYLAVLAAIESRLALTAALVAAFQVGIVFLNRGTLRSLGYTASVSTSDQMSKLVEIVSGVRQLKAGGAETAAASAWQSRLNRQLNAETRLSTTTAALNAFVYLCEVLGPLLVLYLGTLSVLAGRLSLGHLVMANALAGGLFIPLSRCVGVIYQVQSLAVSLYRLDNIAGSPQELYKSTGVVPTLKGRIELTNVSYRYPGTSEYSIRNVSAVIEPGSKTAIVGGTGAGKTTLMNLLLGFDVPEEGTIYFDDIQLTAENATLIRKSLGVVLQEIALFKGSIRDNIAMGDRAVTDDMIVRATRSAHIHDDIARLPMGYDTVVAENGANFSGGQRQRLALARALVRQPAILLLDEATSHLDSQTETYIDRVISRMRTTRLVIAHRLSTIVDADRIFVLDKGELREFGTHSELLAAKGHYADLVRYALKDIGEKERACVEVEQDGTRTSDYLAPTSSL